ncbi:MAG TPA: nuclear transport factor 2 family protein [Pyrinomonadaceae bacterium]|nr:nuclear transport factor 2 family protein [Pyrinomonadaceae bacterium]
MNKIAIVMLVAVVVLGATACSPTADTNVNAGLTTNKNSAPEPVNTASIEAEVKKLEAEWPKAYKSKDGAAVKAILADDIVLTYPDGSTGTKNDEVQMTETGAITYDSWDTVDGKVTVLDADAAFMTGRTTIKNGKLKDPKTQQTIDISGEYRYLDVYAKRNGKWQVVASQVTQVRPPQK